MIKYRNTIPCGYRVLVELKKQEEEKEKKSEGGIIMEIRDEKRLKAIQRSTQEAYVRSIGKLAFTNFGDGQPWCKEGDLVLICKYSGDDLDDVENDKVYRVIYAQDIQAIIDEETK